MIYLNGNPVSVTMFPDSTSQVWKIPNLDIKIAEIIWDFTSESEFLHLAQLSDLLYSLGIPKRNLTMRYLPYGRQDKPISNNSTFALHTFAKLLNTLKFHKVTIVDPHSEVALFLIENSVAVYLKHELLKSIVNTGSEVICYPDAGAVMKYTQIKEIPYVNFPYIYGEKIRDPITGNIDSYSLKSDPKDRIVMIVDDICDGGMTFKLLSDKLIKAGAKEVNLFVSHGLFTKGLKTLKESGINRIFTKDGEAFGHNDSVVYR